MQTKNIELWGLRKSDHQWVLLQSSNSNDPGKWNGNNTGFSGGEYDYPTVTKMYGRLELEVQDGVASFIAGGNEEVEHWWPTNKPEHPWASFNPGDYKGYYAKAKMRIEGPDASKASYVAQIGVDPHLGHGRWNKLTTGWQNFSITTLEESTLRAYPPPDGITTDATITSDQFFSGTGVTTATNASQQFIYNTTDGSLFFNADGNGIMGASVHIAVVLWMCCLAFIKLRA